MRLFPVVLICRSFLKTSLGSPRVCDLYNAWLFFKKYKADSMILLTPSAPDSSEAAAALTEKHDTAMTAAKKTLIILRSFFACLLIKMPP